MDFIEFIKSQIEDCESERKPIAIVGEHDQLKFFEKQFKDEAKRVEKEIDKLKKDAIEKRTKIWEQVEKYIAKTPSIKSDGKGHYQFDDGIIYEVFKKDD
jgi:hypothetical protein